MHHFCHFGRQRCRLGRHRQQQYDHTDDMVPGHTDRHLVTEVAEPAIYTLLQSKQNECVKLHG